MTLDPLLARHAGATLLPLARLGDPDAASVVLGAGGDRLDVVVVRCGGVRAFVNECPHAFTTLETFDGRFFDAEDPALLVCSTHGARFRAADGVCVAGSCRGKRLRPVAVETVDGTVRIAAG